MAYQLEPYGPDVLAVARHIFASQRIPSNSSRYLNSKVPSHTTVHRVSFVLCLSVVPRGFSDSSSFPFNAVYSKLAEFLQVRRCTRYSQLLGVL